MFGRTVQAACAVLALGAGLALAQAKARVAAEVNGVAITADEVEAELRLSPMAVPAPLSVSSLLSSALSIGASSLAEHYAPFLSTIRTPQAAPRPPLHPSSGIRVSEISGTSRQKDGASGKVPDSLRCAAASGMTGREADAGIAQAPLAERGGAPHSRYNRAARLGKQRALGRKRWPTRAP